MHGLNFDETDSNYMLLNEIFKIIGSRESKQIMSRNGLKPLNKVISLVKTIILAAYFECSISFVVDELKSKIWTLEKDWILILFWKHRKFMIDYLK